jgi:uncharacterized protein (TIGR02246 family)
MRATFTLLGLILVGAGLRAGTEDEPNAQKAAPPAASKKSNRPEDAKAIRAQVETFIRAYHQGDAKAAAALFTEDARVVDEGGEATEGRAAIEGLFQSVFAASPGAKIEITTESLRFLAPDVAEEEGRGKAVPADDGSPVLSRYSVLYVKQGGRWLQSSVRELPDTEPSNEARLKALEWMLGEWVSESEDGVVYSDTRWAESKNFLLRAFSMRVKGRPAMTGSQMIGWDPLTNQIKSWVFDSEGGVGEGLWSRKGDTWVIKSTGVFRDGRTTSATQIVTPEGKDKVHWRTADRTLGGRVLDDVDEIILVRKPPQPK